MHFLMLFLIDPPHRQDRLRYHLRLFVVEGRHPFDGCLLVLNSHYSKPIRLAVARGEVVLIPFFYTLCLYSSALHFEMCKSLLQMLARV